MDELGTVVLATGALGTTAFAIVEGLKGVPIIGDAGFGTLMRQLSGFSDAFRVAFGSDYEQLIRSIYFSDRTELARTIRQGVRVGLTPATAYKLAGFVGVVEPDQLRESVEHFAQGDDGGDQSDDSFDVHRNTMARFDMAADARIDAAITLALRNYQTAVRTAAMFVSLLIAVVVGYYLNSLDENANYVLKSVCIGLAAVPVAPIAKDLAGAITSATRAVKGG